MTPHVRLFDCRSVSWLVGRKVCQIFLRAGCYASMLLSEHSFTSASLFHILSIFKMLSMKDLKKKAEKVIFFEMHDA